MTLKNRSLLCVSAVLAGFALPVMAESGKASPASSFELQPAKQSVPALLAQANTPAEEKKETVVVERKEVEESKTEEPSLPISFNATYYLYSDYVFRGVNFSEYQGEGREKPVHQMSTSLSYSTESFGTIGFDTFWSWYADQEKLNPFSTNGWGEYDFYVWYEYEIKPIATTAKFSYNFYNYPYWSKLYNSDSVEHNNSYDRTQEWQLIFTHNDAWMWKWLFPDNEEGVLNPTFEFTQDVGIGAGAVWMDLGISHDFTFDAVPDLTITPNYNLTAEGCGYTRRILDLEGGRDTTRMMYQQVGLTVDYDLTKLLHLPKWAGAVNLSGFLYYNDAFKAAERDDTIQDEFFGGMSVGWTWGG